MNPTYSSALVGTFVTIGNLAIWLGLLCSVATVGFYWTAMLRTMRRPPEPIPPPPGAGKRRGAAAATAAEDLKTQLAAIRGRQFFILSCACFVIGALALWTLIFNQQYVVAYIHKNSNSHLPIGYRFASFWSDQEGTFFLWGLYNTVLGTVLLRRAQQDERWVMPFFALVNVSLFALLCFMNPFWMHPIPELKAALNDLLAKGNVDVDRVQLALNAFPKAGDTWGYIVHYFGWGSYLVMEDGKGLNEQLQNFWMVIHPPTLFVGYSSMLMPASFALGALMKRDYDTWVNRVAPWLSFSWAVLGLGIFLGAYWAYETLGWGGYWSWDPVENSSILPWLVGTALLHGLMGQRSRGNFKQANLFLGVMAGFAVLLGSFLVRSGVLQDISVHAFASPQKSVFITLLSVMVIWLVVGVSIWVWRFRDIQSQIAYEHIWERHFGFFLALIFLSTTAVVVAAGVTWPVFMPLFGMKKEAISFTFYNIALLPVVFAIVLLMAITPLMPWRQARDAVRPPKTFTRVALVLCGLFAIYFLGAGAWAVQGHFRTQNDPAYIGVALMLGLALVTNLVCLFRSARGGFLSTGGWLAHIGFLLMLVGVIWTSRFNMTRSVQKVELNEEVRAFGWSFKWTGQRPAETAEDRERMLIQVSRGGQTLEADPKLFVSKINGNTMAWPWIHHLLFDDLYVEPTGVDNTGSIQFEDIKEEDPQAKFVPVQYRKGDPEDVVLLTLSGLDMSDFQKAMRDKAKSEITLWANTNLNINGESKPLRLPLKLHRSPEEGIKMEPVPVAVRGLNQSKGYTVSFVRTNFDPSDLRCSFEMTPNTPIRHGYFQVLYVPGIRVLWMGCYIMVAGAFMVYLRRAKLARRNLPVKAGSAERSRPAAAAGAAATPAESVGAE